MKISTAKRSSWSLLTVVTLSFALTSLTGCIRLQPTVRFIGDPYVLQVIDETAEPTPERQFYLKKESAGAWSRQIKEQFIPGAGSAAAYVENRRQDLIRQDGKRFVTSRPMPGGVGQGLIYFKRPNDGGTFHMEQYTPTGNGLIERSFVLRPSPGMSPEQFAAFCRSQADRWFYEFANTGFPVIE